MTVLEVESLRVGYNGVEVVRGVTFTLERFERVVVMGPSGSGKTTLLKSIPRLVEPSGGRILFDGVEVTSLKDEPSLRRVRSRIGYLPQQYGLFPHMRVIDNVAFPLRVVRKLPRREAEEIALRHLEAFKIEGLAYKYPSQLSGGQQQRAALARALAVDPDLLLLDEPTSALDPESRVDVLEALYQVARLGKAMIIVTHELDFAFEAADRVIFMEDGRIVAEGTPESILESNQKIKGFVKKLADSVSRT